MAFRVFEASRFLGYMGFLRSLADSASRHVLHRVADCQEFLNRNPLFKPAGT